MIPQQQRSPQWLKWRRDKITGTDAGIIMGSNRFKSLGELFEEKLGLRAPEEENDAMRRGNELEEEARWMFEESTGFVVFPQVCANPIMPWQVASLDGMSIEKDVAVEIKCPGQKVALEVFNKKEMPSYYYSQLQHQMAVTGLKEMYFFSYVPRMEDTQDLTTILKIDRDEEYIGKLIEREKWFYEILMKGFKEIENHEFLLDTMKQSLYVIYEES